MKKHFLIIALLCSMFSFAQDSIQPERKSVVTFSLLSPTFSYAPRYTAGYMHKVAPRWWAGLEAGYGNYSTAFGMARESGSDYITPDYKLYEVRPEVYYDLRPSSKLKHLVSAELFYIHHTDHYTTDRYNGKDGNEYRYDAADYKRIKTGLTVNYTLLFYFTDQFGMLSKTGFGIKRRNVRFSNVVNKTLLPYNPGDDEEGDWFGIEPFQEDEGVSTKFNFNFDLKLFFKF